MLFLKVIWIFRAAFEDADDRESVKQNRSETDDYPGGNEKFLVNKASSNETKRNRQIKAVSTGSAGYARPAKSLAFHILASKMTAAGNAVTNQAQVDQDRPAKCQAAGLAMWANRIHGVSPQIGSDRAHDQHQSRPDLFPGHMGIFLSDGQCVKDQ